MQELSNYAVELRAVHRAPLAVSLASVWRRYPASRTCCPMDSTIPVAHPVWNPRQLVKTPSRLCKVNAQPTGIRATFMMTERLKQRKFCLPAMSFK